jgi:hypothetical protein
VIRTNRISVTERFKPLHKEGEALLKGDSHAHQDQTSVLPGKHNERVQVGRKLERLGGSLKKRDLVGRVSFPLQIQKIARCELVLSSFPPLVSRCTGVFFIYELSPFSVRPSLPTLSTHPQIQSILHCNPSSPSLLLSLSGQPNHLLFSSDNRWRLPRRVCP